MKVTLPKLGAAVLLLSLALPLASCGRRGPPELPPGAPGSNAPAAGASGENAAAAEQTAGAAAGTETPNGTAANQAPPRPRKTFLLDPLL